jgi:hypothetical protein
MGKRGTKMPNINWADYGFAGVTLAIIVVIIFKLPDIIISAKGKNTEDKNDKPKISQDNKEFKALLENNTMAIVELTQFLKTQSEVDKEKEKQSIKILDSIDSKLNRLLELQTEHMAKCDTKCIH